MNVELLRRVQDKIRTSPEEFDMSDWAGRTQTSSHCGTTACIAGWAILFEGEEQHKSGLLGYTQDIECTLTFDVGAEARKLLDLDQYWALYLFHRSSWPLEYHHDPVAYIDYFISVYDPNITNFLEIRKLINPSHD